jgi:hypothetical protein
MAVRDRNQRRNRQIRELLASGDLTPDRLLEMTLGARGYGPNTRSGRSSSAQRHEPVRTKETVVSNMSTALALATAWAQMLAGTLPTPYREQQSWAYHLIRLLEWAETLTKPLAQALKEGDSDPRAVSSRIWVCIRQIYGRVCWSHERRPVEAWPIIEPYINELVDLSIHLEWIEARWRENAGRKVARRIRAASDPQEGVFALADDTHITCCPRLTKLLNALIAAGSEGLSLPQLEAVCSDARKVLKRGIKQHPQLSEHISWPKVKGRKYRVVHDPRMTPQNDPPKPAACPLAS